MRKFEVLKPECYSGYSCKGGDCRYSCCYGWDITFDQADRKVLLKKGAASQEQIYLVDKERQKGACIYAMDLKENGYCPLLTEGKLCQVQQEHGEKSMPVVCREFPHIYHQYLNKLELGLSLGCEKVLELLYEEHGSLRFVNKMETLPDYQRIAGTADAKNRLKYPALTYYYDIQSLCLGILQAEDAGIEDRMILLGMAMFHIDSLVREGNHHQIPAYINKFINDMESVNAVEYLQEISTEHLGVLCSNITTALNFMEYTDGRDIRCKELTKKIVENLQVKYNPVSNDSHTSSADSTLEFSVEAYHKCQKKFHTFIKGKEYFLEHIAVASMFHFNTPFYNLESGVWKDYTYFVWSYAMIKFAMTAILEEESTVSDMIDCCAIIFRRLGHNTRLYEYMIKNLEAAQSNSVAHMALILKSC